MKRVFKLFEKEINEERTEYEKCKNKNWTENTKR